MITVNFLILSLQKKHWDLLKDRQDQQKWDSIDSSVKGSEMPKMRL